MSPTHHSVRCPVKTALLVRVKTLLKSLLREQISKLQSQLLDALFGAATSNWDVTGNLKAAVVRLRLHSFSQQCSHVLSSCVRLQAAALPHKLPKWQSFCYATMRRCTH